MAGFGVNGFFRGGGGRTGARHDPYLGFQFLVEIEGLIAGGFSEVTGLQVEVEFQEYVEGGVNDYVHKLPGPMRYPQNLVLRRGLTDMDTLWGWMQEVAQGIIRRRNGTIYLLDAAGRPATAWDFRAAYPVRWTGPDLRADSAQVAMESIELAHRGIVRAAAVTGGRPPGGTGRPL